MQTPGIKTTEFWLTLASLVYVAILPAIPHGTEIGNVVTAVAALLVALGYAWARSFVKK